MDADEARAFLLAGTRTGKLATVTAAGRPHVAPIWFVLDGDDVIFTTAATSVKGRNLLRDASASLCVDDDRPPFGFVTLSGTVALSEDLDEMLPWATRIGSRYMGPARAEEFGRRNAVSGELLVRLTPTHTIAIAAVSD
jgi:PPOX class probable F420-dependent enzyme